MKKGFLLSLVIFSGLFLFSGISFAGDLNISERIDNFAVTLKLNSDASVNVTERIDYDFGIFSRHGIFRKIPVKYKARGGNYGLRISDIFVRDENGFPYRFNVNKPFFDNNIEIKIGDPDKLISGKKTYIISYKIQRAINYFDSRDELYWNVTGNEWLVPIEKSSARVILPKAVAINTLQKTCFAGLLGSAAGCSDSAFIADNNNLAEEIDFEQNSRLSQGEGLTIVAGFPKGIVAAPSAFDYILDTIRDNWILFVPVFTFFVLFYLWHTRGRDPRGRGTIVAQYDAPDNLTPAQVGTLIDEKADNKDISAEIIYLAVRGYLKITRIEDKGLVFKSKDYLLERLKSGEDLENDFDRDLMFDLFPSSTQPSVILSTLKNTFYTYLQTIQKSIYKSLVAKGYFLKDPGFVRKSYQTVGGMAVVVGIAFWYLVFTSLFGIISVIVSGIIIFLFGFIMPARTKKGVEAREHILGLREYLSVAEKERIRFHNAPEKNPQLFEKLLPYAMVLGVEKEWAKQFEGLYTQQPSWYNDPAGGAFSALFLAASLNNFNSSANSLLSSHPSSASSGGSGFGGGGFSGGGFGGGGGGSW